MPDDVTLQVRRDTFWMRVLDPNGDGKRADAVVELPRGYYHGETTSAPFGDETDDCWVMVRYNGEWVGQLLSFLRAISFNQEDGSKLVGALINLGLEQRVQLGLPMAPVEPSPGEAQMGGAAGFVFLTRPPNRDGQGRLPAFAE